MTWKQRVCRRVGLGVCAIIGTAAIARPPQTPAQSGGRADSPSRQKAGTVATKPLDELSGEKLFQSNCAVCHGRDAKGEGPAAPALKAIAPDLTVLAKDNGGIFPDEFVKRVLNNGWDYPGHGTKEMPIWGPIFQGAAHGDAAAGKLRASKVLEYLRSIQQK